MAKTKIIAITGLTPNPILFTPDDGRKPRVLTEKQLGQHIHHFSELTVTAKRKHLNRWLEKKCKVLLSVDISSNLPNAPWKVGGHVPIPADIDAGARAVLSVTELFKSPSAGVRLLADTLCGLHMTALRETEPTFCPAVSIKSSSPEIEGILRVWAQAVVPRKKWIRKRWRVKRSAVLDYRRQGLLSPRLRDYSILTVKTKCGKIRQPFPYRDTLMLVIGAEAKQIRELGPYSQDAAIILLNSSVAGMDPTVFPALDTAAYDPGIFQTIAAESPRIASLLRYWWGYWDDEDSWAAQIVQDARTSFEPPNSRYVSVQLDPRELREAIRYRVFLSFLDMLEAEGFLTTDELTPCRQRAKEVFDPAPPEPVVIRRVEDPEVFIGLMREIIEEQRDLIISEGDRFTAKNRPLAARRAINGKTYYIFLEDGWAKVFARTARGHKDLDCSFFQRETWVQDYQKMLCENERELIKHTGSAHRYRYDLYGTGKRDGTYVLAVPVQLVEE